MLPAPQHTLAEDSRRRTRIVRAVPRFALALVEDVHQVERVDVPGDVAA